MKLEHELIGTHIVVKLWPICLYQVCLFVCEKYDRGNSVWIQSVAEWLGATEQCLYQAVFFIWGRREGYKSPHRSKDGREEFTCCPLWGSFQKGFEVPRILIHRLSSISHRHRSQLCTCISSSVNICFHCTLQWTNWKWNNIYFKLSLIWHGKIKFKR